jgi:hypothetical protein
LKKAMMARPPSRPSLRPIEIHGLHAVGALVDHGDAGIADELLDAGLGDIAVAAEELLRLDGVVEADIGQHALEHRRHQAELVVGRLALGGVAGAMGDVGLERIPDARRRGPPR